MKDNAEKRFAILNADEFTTALEKYECSLSCAYSLTLTQYQI